MKKFLLSAFAASTVLLANAATPTFNWAYAIDTKYANDQIGAITATSDNKVVSISHFASQVDGDNFTYNDEVIGSPLATSTENRNLVIIKHDNDGKNLWAVYSKQGYFDSANSSVTATPDGGVLVFARPRGSQVGTNLYEQPQLVDATNAEIDFPEFPTLNWTYNPVLIKISGEGAVQWVRHIAIDELPVAGDTKATTEGVNANAVAVDADGNIFIAGNFRAPIIATGQKNSHYVIQPRNASTSTTSGGLFIIKLDENGDYLAQASVSGKATRDQINGLVYADGNLYFAGNVQGAEGDIITVGDKSITLENDLDGIIYGSVATADLSANYLGYVKAFGSTDGKHTTQIKAVRVFDGNIYVLGCVKGGFAAAGASEAVASSETTALNGYVVKLSASDGSFDNVKVQTEKNGSTVVIGSLFDIFKYNDKIYTFGYAMNAALGVSIAEYDNDSSWELANEYYLISGGGTPTTAAGVAIDNNGNITISARGNKAFSFLGSETTITPLDSKFGCAIASFSLSDQSTGANSIAAQAAAVFSADKTSVIVKTDAPINVSIHNAAGQQIKAQAVPAGTTHIALPQGLYLVNDTKVIVG